MAERGSTYRRAAGLALAATVLYSLLFWPAGPAGAQTVREVFEKVAPSVAIIRARGRDVEAGARRASPTGSGVLISAEHVDPAGAGEALGPRARGQGGVVDRLIVARHRALGATTVTFDRRQARLEGGVLSPTGHKNRRL